MSDSRKIQPEDLTLYALQLLSADEARSIEILLAESSEDREELRAIRSDLALVALTAELETPAPAARERFLKQVAREQKVVSIDRPVPSPTVVADPEVKKTSGKLLPWLGWAVAAGVTFSAVNLYNERRQMQTTIADQSAQLKAETAQMATLSSDAAKARAIMDTLIDPDAMRVTLNTTPAAKALPQGRATYQAEKGSLVFIGNNLVPLPAAKVYELWLIPADGTAPIPAGTFRPDARGNASVVMPNLPKGVAAKAFGVTMEAEGGATTPTMPILLVGA